ncbi:MAG: hypothetical protein IJQ12_09845 [Lachnospiraceae bacterium]|nr:hypothetical protein [Lachnospiraceae bacterium]
MRHMKKYFSVLLMTALITGVLAGCSSGAGGGAASSQPAAGTQEQAGSAATQGTEVEAVDTANIPAMNLTVSSGWGIGHCFNVYLCEPMFAELKEMTGGNVDYTMFTDGELIALTAELDALRQNQADVVTSLSPFYDTARFPLSAVTGLPTTKINEVIAGNAVYALMNSDVDLDGNGGTFYKLEFQDNGVEAWPCNPTPGYYICLTKGNEITSVADFNAGLRLRTASSAAEEYVKLLGATPVSLPGSECYDALSRGALEGIIMPTDWVNLGYTEMLGQVIDTGVGTNLSYIAVSTDTWNSWTPEMQAAFEKAYEDNYVPSFEGQTFYRERDEQELLDAGGLVTRIDELPEDVQELIANATTQTWYRWIDTMEAMGEPGKACAILWRDCLLEAGGDVPEEIKTSLEDYEPNT